MLMQHKVWNQSAGRFEAGAPAAGASSRRTDESGELGVPDVTPFALLHPEQKGRRLALIDGRAGPGAGVTPLQLAVQNRGSGGEQGGVKVHSYLRIPPAGVHSSRSPLLLTCSESLIAPLACVPGAQRALHAA